MKLCLKTSAIALLASTFLVAPASASDLFDAPSGDYAQAAKTVNWSGFYIGGRAGYGNANHDLSVHEYFKDYCGDSGQPEDHGFDDPDFGSDHFAYPVDGACNPSEEKLNNQQNDVVVSGQSRELANLDGLNSHGFVGGGQIGLDKQMGRWVFGLFGTYDWTNMETTLSLSDALIGNGGAEFSLEKNYEWSAGARAGVLVNPRTLLYALAAYTETEYELNGPGVGAVEGLKTTNTFSGISAGGGIEFAVTNNIFAGLEYTHLFGGEETWFNTYNAGENHGLKVVDDLDEDKIMGTLKIKLNSGIFN